MVKKILQKEAHVLREIAKEVPPIEIKSSKIKKIIEEMKEALNSQEDGVAIAAPQIGYSLRIFVVSKRIDGIIKEAKKVRLNHETKVEKEMSLTMEEPATDMVFINPKIKKISKEKQVVEEGCLSVRFLYGKVSRGIKATVEAYDENGKKFTRGGSGLLAQIFQHEIDHLNGILFLDKAKYVEEIIPEHIKHPGQKLSTYGK
ncbi:MAG: peptide deformylase [Minisyncoccia bacterium]